MLKKAGLLLLIPAFLLMSVPLAMETPVEAKADAVEFWDRAKRDDMEKTLNELLSIRLHRMKVKKSIEKGGLAKEELITLQLQDQELEKRDADVYAELRRKGLRPLTPDEEERFHVAMDRAMKMRQKDKVTTLAASPPVWGPYRYVDILTWGEKYVTVNGVTHKLWIVYAIPKSPGGGPPLYRDYEPFYITNQPTEWSQIQNKVLNLLLQRAIGEIPIIKWLPYDYFWPERQGYTSFSSYTIDPWYTVSMKYVFKYFPASDIWLLTASSNNVEITEVHTIRSFIYGQNYQITREPERIVYGQNYSNIEVIAAQSIGGYIIDPVGTITYTGFDGSRKFSFTPYYAAYAADLAR